MLTVNAILQSHAIERKLAMKKPGLRRVNSSDTFCAPISEYQDLRLHL